MNGRWINADRVIAAEPGPKDVCVVTLVDGRRVSVDHVLDYSKALNAAYELAGRLVGPVKVLPMGATELAGLLRLRDTNFAASTAGDVEGREMVISTCREALRACDDGMVRQEAYELLVSMGQEA